MSKRQLLTELLQLRDQAGQIDVRRGEIRFLLVTEHGMTEQEVADAEGVARQTVHITVARYATANGLSDRLTNRNPRAQAQTARRQRERGEVVNLDSRRREPRESGPPSPADLGRANTATAAWIPVVRDFNNEFVNRYLRPALLTTGPTRTELVQVLQALQANITRTLDSLTAQRAEGE